MEIQDLKLKVKIEQNFGKERTNCMLGKVGKHSRKFRNRMS